MRPTTILAVLPAIAVALPAPDAEARPLREAVGPYQLQVLVEGQPARTFEHRGETWVLGQLGDRYTLRVSNRSGRRIEAVVTVDGRDVIDGRAGDFRNQRGYLVPAWGSVDVDGWRISEREAAVFRFSSVSDSYAARTGAARDVGVIGVAVFPERQLPPPRPVYVPRPAPTSPPWGFPSDDRLGDDKGGGGRGEGVPHATDSAPAPAAPSGGGGGRAAGEATAAARPRGPERPGLGTEYGEAVASDVREVEFVRQNPGSPQVVLGARYNDREGLIAIGIAVDAPRYWSDGDLRDSADPFPGVERRYAAPPPGWRR
jgi:hypothetical protein